MKTCFRFVQHHQGRRTRSEKSRDPQNVTQGAIGEFSGPEWTQKTHLVELKGNSAIRFPGNFKVRSGKSRANRSGNALSVAYLDNRLDRGGQVAPVLAEHRRAGAELRDSGRGLKISTELIVEAPTADPFANHQDLRCVLRIGNL